jgi:hypothetical protein
LSRVELLTAGLTSHIGVGVISLRLCKRISDRN